MIRIVFIQIPRIRMNSFFFVLVSLLFINRNNCFHLTYVSINIVPRSHVLPGLVYSYKNSQNIHIKYAFFGFSFFMYSFHGNCSWVEIINWINLQSDEEWVKVWKHDNFKCRNKPKKKTTLTHTETYLTCIYLRNIYHFSCNKLTFFFFRAIIRHDSNLCKSAENEFSKLSYASFMLLYLSHSLKMIFYLSFSIKDKTLTVCKIIPWI